MAESNEEENMLVLVDDEELKEFSEIEKEDTVDAKCFNASSFEAASDRSGEKLSAEQLTQTAKEIFEKPQPEGKKSFTRRLIDTSKNLLMGRTREKVSIEPFVEHMPKQIPAILPELRCYKTNHRYRGRVVIIDEAHFQYHQELSYREGSDLDAKKLRTVFVSLGFKPEHIKLINNATFESITYHLNAVAKQDFSDHDMLMCVILTHGESGRLYAADKIFEVERLWEPFAEDKCMSLKDKPKIFIIQACRGSRLDAGVDVKSPKEKRRHDDTTDGDDQGKREEVEKHTLSKTVVSVQLGASHSLNAGGEATSRGDESIQGSNKQSKCSEYDVAKFNLSSLSTALSEETLQMPHIKDHNRRRSDTGVSLLSVPSPDRRTSLPGENEQLRLPPEGFRRSSLPMEVLREQLMLPNPHVRRTRGDQVDANTNDRICLNSSHNISDMLVAYSTVDGFYSFRRPTEGSWFIQAVCDKLLKLHKTEDLMSIMTHVNNYVATDMMSHVSDKSKLQFHQKKQVPCIASTLTKLLYFTRNDR